MEDDRLSASWQTPVKEIIERAIIIHPAFCSEMILVTDEKSRFFVMRLKFSYRKMISLHECAKLCVISCASRARYARMIVKLAGDWHAKHQWPCVNGFKCAQEQFQIGPARGLVHAVAKCYVTRTGRDLRVQARRF